MKNQKQLTWSPKLVPIEKIKPTPVNYKIKNALGAERLKESLKLFGIAGTVVVNTDYTLIDGNSRLEQEKEKGSKKLWVSVPNRKLTPQEFKEMTALYDFAKAGDVDLERIKGDLGSEKDFYNKFKLEVPLQLLQKMGKNAPVVKGEITKLEHPEPVVQEVSDIKMVQLFFSNKQEEEFRKCEEKAAKKLKTKNTTETVLKVFKQFFK